MSDDLYLPDQDSWNAGGDLRDRIASRLNVQVETSELRGYDGATECPFNIARTVWVHLDRHGKLDEGIFLQALTDAVKSFAEVLNRYPLLKSVRLFTKPEIRYSLAYHDWAGPPHAFDIRTITRFGVFADPEVEGDQDHGLEFTISTLIEKRCSKATLGRNAYAIHGE